MATDATPGGVDIKATAAARLLEHVNTWKCRLRDAVDRHYNARAYDAAPELHDVVDRASDDLGRVFGDVGLCAPVEAYDGPRPRRGPLRMAVRYAPDADRADVATGDPDEAYAALTGWGEWLKARAVAVPATGHDPRLDEYRPAKDFALAGAMMVNADTLREWERKRLVRTKDNGAKGTARRVRYMVIDVVTQRRPTPTELTEWLDSVPK